MPGRLLCRHAQFPQLCFRSPLTPTSARRAVLDSPLVKADHHALTANTSESRHSRNRNKKGGLQDRCVVVYTYTSVRLRALRLEHKPARGLIRQLWALTYFLGTQNTPSPVPRQSQLSFSQRALKHICRAHLYPRNMLFSKTSLGSFFCCVTTKPWASRKSRMRFRPRERSPSFAERIFFASSSISMTSKHSNFS